jgi:FkbM family methyltransferase
MEAIVHVQEAWGNEKEAYAARARGPTVSVTTDAVHFAGRGLRKAGRFLMDYRSLRGVWLDVGARQCDHTYSYALFNPSLQLFAFEPNLQVASKMFNSLPNIQMIPMAVAETDGCAEFNITAYPEASSLLPLDDENARKWVGGHDLRVVSKMVVPTIRLDTFLNMANIQTVDYLKIDAQGMDLAIVKSAGNRLKDIRRIHLEVCVTPYPLYRGVPSKSEVVEFMMAQGFALVVTETQGEGQEENLTFENKLGSST